MDRKLLEALRLVQGRGQMSAKDKYGWHPPLEDDGDAMPNQPRDIRNLDKAPEPFLPGKTGADFGQDQFGTPSPNAEKMAKAVGALRLPPVVAPEPTSMKDLMGLPASAGEDLVDPRGDAKTQSIAQNHPGHMVVSVDPSSYFGDEQGDKEIMSKASAIPYTMPKAQRQAFKGPTSHDPFQMGSAEDPNAGTDPWLAHPQASEGPAGPQPESSDSSNSGDLSGVGEYPESIPMEDMADDIDTSGLVDSNPEQPAVPEQSELQKYIAEMNGKGAQAEDRRDSSFLDSQQKMNSDMGLYKLLFASANKIGSHAGQQSSDEPFNSFADGAIKSNDKRSELLTKDRATQKKAGDDKLKALMFMDKQKQDKEKYASDLDFRGKQLAQLATDKDEGRKVQRDSNELMAWYRSQMLEGQTGIAKDKAQLEREKIEFEKEKAGGLLTKDNRKLDADIAIAGAEQGHKANTLAEMSRHNQAEERIAADRAKQEAKEKAHKAKGISQGAAKTDMFRKRMANADDAFAKLSTKPGFDATSTKDTVLGAVPFLGNSLVSKDRQLQEQFQQEFVQATLRDESGATIGTDEYNKNMKKYFPVYGDSKETIARKALLRKADIKTLQESYDAQKGEADSLGGEGSSIGTLPAPPPGKVRVKDPDTGRPLLIDEADLQEALKDGAERM